MKLARTLAAGAAALAMLGAAQASQAAIVDWTLSNGTFDDGGTFSGTFTFDTAADAITDWNVVTTGGINETYSSPGGCVLFFCTSASNSGSGPSFSSSVFIFSTTFDLTNIPLSAGPGSVAALTGQESSFNPIFGNFSRIVTGGDAVGVTAVPEPASWALMIGGLGLAGAAFRRRRALALA